MNGSKIGNLLAYISSKVKDINLRKLIKLVYLIDEKSVTSRGLSVTWLTYYVWEKGPVAPCLYDIKQNGGAFSEYIEVHRNREEKVIVTPSVKEEKSALQFSKKELKLIDSVIHEYGGLSADELSEITHKRNGLWDVAKKKNNIDFESCKGRSDIKLNLIDLLEGDDEKISVYNDAYEIAVMC